MACLSRQTKPMSVLDLEPLGVQVAACSDVMLADIRPRVAQRLSLSVQPEIFPCNTSHALTCYIQRLRGLDHVDLPLRDLTVDRISVKFHILKFAYEMLY